jgi:hypothetical protein
MPRARIHRNNAARQKAYRERQAALQKAVIPNREVVKRVVAADAKSRA